MKTIKQIEEANGKVTVDELFKYMVYCCKMSGKKTTIKELKNRYYKLKEGFYDELNQEIEETKELIDIILTAIKGEKDKRLKMVRGFLKDIMDTLYVGEEGDLESIKDTKKVLCEILEDLKNKGYVDEEEYEEDDENDDEEGEEWKRGICI